MAGVANGGTVTCSRVNTGHQYPETLYFYLKVHQNAFGSRALPGPTGGYYSLTFGLRDFPFRVHILVGLYA